MSAMMTVLYVYEGREGMYAAAAAAAAANHLMQDPMSDVC
jgi:hypothetical protein